MMKQDNAKIDSVQLKELCMKLGADDVGIVEIGRPALSDQRNDISYAFPQAKTLVCMVRRINPESIRTPVSYIKDTEFNYLRGEIIAISRQILSDLDLEGVKGVAECGNFPMDASKWPGKMWYVSLRPLAIEGGLGQMGINRNILHPVFGSFVYIFALIIDKEVTQYDHPIDVHDNPCLKCNLCVTVCPTGAISQTDEFSFVSCFTHNYREKLGGFSDWIENVSDSRNSKEYRKRVGDQETISMWQSLSFGAGTKCDYCMAVCPAGIKQETSFKENRKDYLSTIAKPLQERKEKVFVIAGSDADYYVRSKQSNRHIQYVSNGIRPNSAAGFLWALPLLFQKYPAKDLSATYHFTFTGDENIKATVCINNQNIKVVDGHEGKAAVSILADSATWLKFLSKEQSMLLAILTRKITIKGPIKLMKAFSRCFPA
jgi:epoxyqueuosine reductase QueG